MRVMCLLRATPKTEAGEFPDNAQEVFEKMGRLMEEMAAAGVLLGGEGLQPSSKGKRVRFLEGKVTSVTDGPFAETKELIAGYCIMKVDTWEEALEWNRRFAQVEGTGESELRPLYENEDFPTEVFSPEQAAREDALRERIASRQ